MTPELDPPAVLEVLDFETGRPAVRGHGRRREYWALLLIVGLAATPYVLLIYLQPLPGSLAIVSLALILVAAPFLQSAANGVSHAARFQLAGANPFAMTGAMAILLGGVDALFDIREDRASRRRNPLGYWTITVVKLAIGPLGMVLVVAEFSWDLILQRRNGRLIPLKLEEFFRVAQHHDQICPEKSNDLFYADLALARLNNDPALYQWLRLRAMVFELQHCRGDLERGEGVPSTNLFRQSILEASRTIVELKWEVLEAAVQQHYAQRPESFPLRPRLAARLVNAARPLRCFLDWIDDTSLRPPTDDDVKLWRQLASTGDPVRPSLLWCALRLLQTPLPADAALSSGSVSAYIDSERLAQMTKAGMLHLRRGELGAEDAVYSWRPASRRAAETAWLA